MNEIITNEEYAHKHYQYLFKRANKTNPKLEDVQALKTFLDNHPFIIDDTVYLPNLVMREFLENLYPEVAKRTVIEEQLENLKRQYGYDRASVIDRMMFDTILVSWLRLNYLEGYLNQYFLSGSEAIDFEFWDKRVSAAQLRFTRSVEALGRLRKFKVNFQINIAKDGGQQINIQDTR